MCTRVHVSRVTPLCDICPCFLLRTRGSMSAGARSRLDGCPSSDLPAGHSLRLLRPSATADAALERLRGGGGGVSLSSRLAAFLPQLAAANAALEARVAAGGDAAATAVNIEAVPEGAAHIAMVRRRRASPRRCRNRGAASARWQHWPRRSPLPPPLPFPSLLPCRMCSSSALRPATLIPARLPTATAARSCCRRACTTRPMRRRLHQRQPPCAAAALLLPPLVRRLARAVPRAMRPPLASALRSGALGGARRAVRRRRK